MIYPEIETYRYDDEVYEVPDRRLSNLERNCSQIFAKGPALTKDFLEKVHSDIVPKRTYIFGRDLNTKRILLICGLFLLFFISLFGVVAMWFTEFFDNAVLSQLPISNTSQHFEMWRKPSVKITLKVYVFNYTNIEEFESKLEKKLHVEEVGPYVYEESMERVNVVFNEDDTVSYQEKRTYTFIPELSKGRQNDRVTVPNIPLISGASVVKDELFFTRLAFSSFLTGMGEKAFVSLPVHNFITGYSSNFYNFSKIIAKFNNEKQPESVGLLAGKIGLQPTVFTMNTGKNDINKYGIIEKINEKDHFEYWSTEECNRLDGGDGSTFPPKKVQHKDPVSFVIPLMCRKVPFFFDKELTILDGKIPAYRYAAPANLFDSADEIPQHQCFCSMDGGVCPLKGTFNVTPCSAGAPMFLSLPHFYNADKSLFNGVSGLSDEERDISTYVDLHPMMGFSMAMRTAVQVNIQIRKAYGVYQLDKYNDDLMLPIGWFEAEVNEKDLPSDYLDIIYEATFTVKDVRMALQWGSLLTMLITLVCIVLVLGNSWQRSMGVGNRGELRSLQRQLESDNLGEI